MPLTTLTAGNVIKASELNANFALCVLTDTSRTITVTHTWTAAQVFSGASQQFGATALPAGVSALTGSGTLIGFTPDVTTNVARSTYLTMVGFGANVGITGLNTGGTVTIPTATAISQKLLALVGGGYDGTNYATAAEFSSVAMENWAVGSHGSAARLETTPLGSTTREVSLLVHSAVTGVTRLIPGATSLVLSNNANNAANLTVLDGGIITFRVSIGSTTALATPGAYAATTGTFFASTVSGATLMGYGTTGDVTLKNRAGTSVLFIGSGPTVTASIGSGTASVDVDLSINGAATAGYGPLLRFKRAASSIGLVGAATTIDASATDDMMIYADTGNAVKIFANAVKIATFSATGLAMNSLAVSGITTLATSGAISTTSTNSTASITTAGGITLGTTAGQSATLTIGAGNSNTGTSGGKIIFFTNNADTNWLIAENFHVANGLEFTPSTAGGGSTFSTPVFTLSSAGAGGFSAGLALSGGTAPTNGIQFGTSAPGSLADGQLWYDGTNLKTRLGGATKTITAV